MKGSERSSFTYHINKTLRKRRLQRSLKMRLSTSKVGKLLWWKDHKDRHSYIILIKTLGKRRLQWSLQMRWSTSKVRKLLWWMDHKVHRFDTLRTPIMGEITYCKMYPAFQRTILYSRFADLLLPMLGKMYNCHYVSHFTKGMINNYLMHALLFPINIQLHMAYFYLNDKERGMYIQ